MHTADGVKAPDLSAAPSEFEVVADNRGFLLRAAPLCVEIMSPTNIWEEIRHKCLLYLAAGAGEVWVCDHDGALHYFDGAGELSHSALVPAVTRQVAT